MSGVLMLVLARARRRPGRWLAPAAGIALAVAFGGAVWAQTQIAATQAARASLSGLTPLQRAVTVSWEGPVTALARAAVFKAFRALGLAAPTEVTLLNPVRLDGIIVRPAGITPLQSWSSAAPPSPCNASQCPVLLAGASVTARTLSTAGARLVIAGHTALRSAAPLGFLPEPGTGEPPLLVTGDARGLDALPGLSGVFRSHSWVAELSTTSLTSWGLAGLERRLSRTQTSLLTASPQFSLSAPFAALDSARATATAAPRRLLLAGGSAVATLVLFIVLSAASLRHDQERELERLELAGAQRRHRWLFVGLEAGWVSALAALFGAVLAVGASIALAGSGHVSASGVLSHSLLTPAGATGLALGWLLATALLCTVALGDGSGAPNVLALAAAVALVATVAAGSRDSGSAALALAPLGCLAAGVVVYRVAGWLASAGERLIRGGPVLGRLALVGLARRPAAPAMAIAFVALSTGLGGFALLYRATLVRSASEQAAQQVPFDATIGPTAAFARPLALAPLPRWRALAAGAVWPVRRTQASYVSGGSSVTVPALGVPAAALPSLRGWQATGASASAPALARRLIPKGPARTPGPFVPINARWLSVVVTSPALDVDVTAALRAPDGRISALDLGVAGPRVRRLHARLPPGDWEVQALELSEPTGLQLTNDHQNGENPGAATQATVPVALGPIQALGPRGGQLSAAGLGSWRAVGPARVQRRGAQSAGLAFSESGLTALVRPRQPSDVRPVPVLADAATAATAGRGHRLSLEIDGLPVLARVVGILARFPSVAPTSAGFVIADQATLASALEAEMPGQGAPDELWVSTHRLAGLRTALSTGPLAALATTYRADVQRALRDAPVARAVMLTLVGAWALSAVLAVLGLLIALLGALRDRALEADLLAQGMGPRALRFELRLRLGLAAAIGVGCGVAVALGLARLAVAIVRTAGATATPDPPVSAVAPLPLLGAWAGAALAALVTVGWMASTRLPHRSAS